MDYRLPVTLISSEILGLALPLLLLPDSYITSSGCNVIDSRYLLFHSHGFGIVLASVFFGHLPETVVDLFDVGITSESHVPESLLAGHGRILTADIRAGGISPCLDLLIALADYRSEFVAAEYPYALNDLKIVVIDESQCLKAALLKIVEKDLLAPVKIFLREIRIGFKVYCHYLARMTHDHIGSMHHGRSVIISDSFALQYNKDDVIVLLVLYTELF